MAKDVKKILGLQRTMSKLAKVNNVCWHGNICI